MKLNHISTVNFNGKIIDVHAHYGYWVDNKKHFGHNDLDVFLKNPLNININGVKSQDNIDKMIISSLDAIGHSMPNGRMNETEALKQALDFASSNEKLYVMPVCQPNLTQGNAEPLRQMLKTNSGKIVGLKFHPRELLKDASGNIQPDNNSWYTDYFKLAQEKNLPCLFHCESDDSGAKKIYNLVKGKYTELPVILGHTGASSNENFEEALAVLKNSIDNKDAKIYADISWLDWEKQLPDGKHTKVKTLITELKSRNALDRILFGTDAPLGCFGEMPVEGTSEKSAYEKMISGIKTMIKKEFPNECDEIIEKIFHKNAQELFFSQTPPPEVKNNSKLALFVAIAGLALGGLALVSHKFLGEKDQQSNQQNNKPSNYILT